MIERAKEHLRGRTLAYRRIFLDHGTDTDTVLADLQKFCRGNVSTFHADPRLHALMEGRREVFLRISHHLRLTDTELWAIYGNKSLPAED